MANFSNNRKRFFLGKLPNLLIISVMVLGLFVLQSCKSTNRTPQHNVLAKDTMQITEGVVTYAISYPGLENANLSPFLPKEIKFVFKGNLSSYIIRSGLGMVQIVRLLNYDKQEFISLLINNLGKNYASKLTADEIRQKETSIQYSYTFTDITAPYNDLTCSKAIVTNLNDSTEFEIFYAPTITINNWNSPYYKHNKLLVKYPFRENNMDMLLELKTIEPKAIDSSFFTVKGEFTWISSSQFNEHLNNLQK